MIELVEFDTIAESSVRLPAREVLEICKSCINHLPDVQVNQIEVVERHEKD